MYHILFLSVSLLVPKGPIILAAHVLHGSDSSAAQRKADVIVWVRHTAHMLFDFLNCFLWASIQKEEMKNDISGSNAIFFCSVMQKNNRNIKNKALFSRLT